MSKNYIGKLKNYIGWLQLGIKEIMNYSPGDLFHTMGHRQLGEDELYYPFDPNKRYLDNVVQTMMNEWSYRAREADTLLYDSRKQNLRIPHRLAITMPRNKLQELEKGIVPFP